MKMTLFILLYTLSTCSYSYDLLLNCYKARDNEERLRCYDSLGSSSYSHDALLNCPKAKDNETRLKCCDNVAHVEHLKKRAAITNEYTNCINYCDKNVDSSLSYCIFNGAPNNCDHVVTQKKNCYNKCDSEYLQMNNKFGISNHWAYDHSGKLIRELW